MRSCICITKSVYSITRYKSSCLPPIHHWSRVPLYSLDLSGLSYWCWTLHDFLIKIRTLQLVWRLSVYVWCPAHCVVLSSLHIISNILSKYRKLLETLWRPTHDFWCPQFTTFEARNYMFNVFVFWWPQPASSSCLQSRRASLLGKEHSECKLHNLWYSRSVGDKLWQWLNKSWINSCEMSNILDTVKYTHCGQLCSLQCSSVSTLKSNLKSYILKIPSIRQ